MDQDDQEIQQLYLEALFRVETRVAEIAFELGLESLRVVIRANIRAVEKAMLDLAETRTANEPH